MLYKNVDVNFLRVAHKGSKCVGITTLCLKKLYIIMQCICSCFPEF